MRMTKESNKRFVVQEHKKESEMHWDLMLEADEILQTYRLEIEPYKLISQQSMAVRIFDHPLKFLTYEGSVNKGKGSVRIVESGTYEVLSEEKENIKLILHGQILEGTLVFTRINEDGWQVSFM
jgi:bifunctional non-homologous end joining protein LigD